MSAARPINVTMPRVRHYPDALREFTFVQISANKVVAQILGYNGEYVGMLRTDEIALLQVLAQKVFDRAADGAKEPQ